VTDERSDDEHAASQTWPAAHAHGERARPVARRTRGWLALALAPFLAATLLGLIALWPGRHHFAPPPQFRTETGAAVAYVHAEVVTLTVAPCGASGDAARSVRCLTAGMRLTSGPQRGTQVALPLARGAGEPTLHVKDKVVLARATDAQGRPTYFFEDFDRGLPLVLLAVVFGILAVVIGRRRGLAALLGLGVAVTVVVEFLLPSLLTGHDPVLVALTAGSAVMVVVLYVSHGFSARTTVALLGTLGGLVLVALAGSLAVYGTHLTGLSSDELTAVQVSAPRLHAAGIILAGLVVGSLGVLNDVTVTQASSVWELHAVNSSLGRWSLYAAAMRIGRDHIASTIYTLLLAYAGAALPVLLLFLESSQPLGVVLNGDLVGSDIVRSLTGAIGLLLAVPLTTAVAVLTVTAPPSAARAGVLRPEPELSDAVATRSATSWSEEGSAPSDA
jgi:uncharacterized membrane protein